MYRFVLKQMGMVGNQIKYRISSYSFREHYSFLKLETQRSHYIWLNVTVNRGAETIQVRKLSKGGNYMRKYGKYKKKHLEKTLGQKHSANIFTSHY